MVLGRVAVAFHQVPSTHGRDTVGCIMIKVGETQAMRHLVAEYPDSAGIEIVFKLEVVSANDCAINERIVCI
jgi:hypothetical protein